MKFFARDILAVGQGENGYDCKCNGRFGPCKYYFISTKPFEPLKINFADYVFIHRNWKDLTCNAIAIFIEGRIFKSPLFLSCQENFLALSHVINHTPIPSYRLDWWVTWSEFGFLETFSSWKATNFHSIKAEKYIRKSKPKYVLT